MAKTNEAEKVLGQWWKTRLAHQAMMLEDAQRLLKQDRAATQAHLEDTHGRPLEAGADDMGIHIGDQVTNQQSGMGKLATAGLIAAALLGGGAGAMWLTNYLSPKEFEIEWQFKDGKMEWGKPKQVK